MPVTATPPSGCTPPCKDGTHEPPGQTQRREETLSSGVHPRAEFDRPRLQHQSCCVTLDKGLSLSDLSQEVNKIAIGLWRR